MKKHLLLFILVLSVLVAHGQTNNKKSKKKKKGKIENTSFILTGFDLKIVDADKFSYHYPPNVDVEVMQIGNSLSLRVTGNKSDRTKTLARTPLTLYIKKEKIKQLKLIDCTFNVPMTWKSPQLRLTASSSSIISFAKFEIDVLSVTASGATELDFAGKATKARFVIASNSTLNKSKITALQASFNASASSQIDISIRADEVRLISASTSRITANVTADKASLNASSTSRINANLDTNDVTIEASTTAIVELTGRTGTLKMANNDGSLISRKKLAVER